MPIAILLTWIRLFSSRQLYTHYFPPYAAAPKARHGVAASPPLFVLPGPRGQQHKTPPLGEQTHAPPGELTSPAGKNYAITSRVLAAPSAPPGPGYRRRLCRAGGQGSEGGRAKASDKLRPAARQRVSVAAPNSSPHVLLCGACCERLPSLEDRHVRVGRRAHPPSRPAPAPSCP